MIIGIMELIIVVSIVAILVFLFKYGGRAAIMMVLGGLCLMFVTGMVVVLALSHHDGPPRHRFAVGPYELHEFPDTRWRYYPDFESREFASPAIEIPIELPQPAVRVMAEVESDIDPLVAGAASVSDDSSRSSSAGETSTQDLTRPAWVDERAGMETGGAYVVTASVERFKTMNEATEAIAVKISDETNSYINRFLGEPDAAEQVGLPSRFIMEQIVTDGWQEVVQHKEFGEMLNLHARLRFDDKVRATISDRYRQSIAQSRLMNVGFGSGIVLLLLSTVYGYLKLDTFTRGYYTGRLRLATAVMILALIAAGGLLAQTVVWS